MGSNGFPKAEYIEDGRCNKCSLIKRTLTCIADDILSEKISGHDDVSLGLDHVNKSRSTWGKSDSIFIK